VGGRRLIDPELVQITTKKVKIIKKNRMKTIKDRQKSYADNRKRPLEFEMGDQLFLKVAPWKHIILF
jgi:hypothetical protein